MTDIAPLRNQLDLVWRFAGDALTNLTDDEALWVPTETSMTMHRDANGSWEPDWIDAEPDFVPATSIAWLQWHVMYWWATVIDRSFGSGGLKRDDVVWEGSEQAMTLIGELHDTWIAHIDGLRADELESGELTSWPYSDDRPFIEVVAWVNAELMKNVSEMAYVRRITPHYRG